MNKISIYLNFILKYYLYFFIIFYVAFSILSLISVEFNIAFFKDSNLNILIRALAVPFLMILMHAYFIYNRMFNDEKNDFTGVVIYKFRSNIEFDKLKERLKTIYFDSKYEEGDDSIKIYYLGGINLGSFVIKVINKENELVVSCRNIMPTNIISKETSKHFKIIEAAAQKQSEEYEISY